MLIEYLVTFGVGGTFNKLCNFPPETRTRRQVVLRSRFKLPRTNRDDALQRSVGPQQPAFVNGYSCWIIGEQAAVLMDPLTQLTFFIVAWCGRRRTDCLPDEVLCTASVVGLSDRRQVVVTKQETLNSRNVDQRWDCCKLQRHQHTCTITMIINNCT